MHARILHICMRYVDHYMACKPARTKLPQSCMIDPIGPCHRAGHATDSEYAMGRGPKPPSALKADAIRYPTAAVHGLGVLRPRIGPSNRPWHVGHLRK